MGLFDGMFDPGNHESPIGALGGKIQGLTDPLSWIFGDKYTNLISHTLPEMSNKALSTVMKPFDKVDQTINPVRRIPIVNRVSGIVADKPADAAAMAIGGYFAAPAIGGALGGGASGGAASAGGAQAFPVSTANGTLLSSGGSGSLGGITAAPGIDLGQMVGNGEGLNVMSSFQIPGQGMDYAGLLQGLGGMGGGQQQPQQPMVPAPAPHLQAGGEQFALPYQGSQFQLQPTAQRLGGLLGGVYGTL